MSNFLIPYIKIFLWVDILLRSCSLSNTVDWPIAEKKNQKTVLFLKDWTFKKYTLLNRENTENRLYFEKSQLT